MHLLQEKFLALLNEGDAILDFGCGCARDAKYFLEKGYHGTATDGSAECVRLASEYTGIEVKEMLFQELKENQAYHGIWACSSILHLPKRDLLTVFQIMCDALKQSGVIYSSFKYGTFEGERNGRYFTDFTEESFGDFMSEGIQNTTFDAIIDEMICNAWYSVREFHIHLSGLLADAMVRDGLERAILLLTKLSGLPASGIFRKKPRGSAGTNL